MYIQQVNICRYTTTISGCDSIITMDLTINNTVFSNDSAEVCDSIEWNGNVYYATGIYIDTDN